MELRKMAKQAHDNVEYCLKEQMERLRAKPIAPPPTGSPDPPTGPPVQQDHAPGSTQVGPAASAMTSSAGGSVVAEAASGLPPQPAGLNNTEYAAHLRDHGYAAEARTFLRLLAHGPPARRFKAEGRREVTGLIAACLMPLRPTQERAGVKAEAAYHASIVADFVSQRLSAFLRSETARIWAKESAPSAPSG